MTENRQLTTASSPADSSLWKNSSREDRSRSILALLGRLALHYYRPDHIETQAKLVMEDMIEDLLPYHPTEIAEACAAWRRTPDASYFPKSGQLIGLIQKATERSIANARAHRPAYRAPLAIEGPRGPLKPWRQILREHGLVMPIKIGADPCE